MSEPRPTNPYRSNLIVPVHKPKFVGKCWRRDADAVTLDLEDSVLPTEKDFARTQVPEAIRIAGQGGADVFVRINSEREMFQPDLAASIHPGLTGIHLPKVESPWDVLEVERMIADLERERNIAPGTVVVHLAIETARGFCQREAIIAASRRLLSVNIGQEDFSRDIGVELTDGDELAIANFLLVVTATAYGALPIGLVGSIANFQDRERFRSIVAKSVKVGLKGACGIHPDQVPILNQGFAPPEDQVALARRVVAIFEESKRRGDGAIALDGRMIDKPLVDRAQQLLARWQAVQDFQAYKEKMVAHHEGTKG
ncbi:MAG: CoA ester lyase [Planctomycetes bacterium]|nr:CoA ester lyase [Planctomycetota bacterium]